MGDSLPSVDIQLKNKESNISIIDLILLSKLENSKSEIRRLIKGKAVKINNQIINDDKFLIQRKSFGENSFLKLSIGKKKTLKN